jgi:hypothetical protein
MRYSLATDVLDVQGVRVARCFPAWERPAADCPRIRLPYFAGIVGPMMPALDPDLRYDWFAPDVAGDISREPHVVWEEVSGNLDGILSVSVAAFGFIEVEARQAWRSVAAALIQAPGWAF